MRKYQGAISLFMVVILLTSFIFGGVFIDASRIVVAKNKVRNSMNAALRSSMSYYDKSLVGDYGLYAFDKNAAQTNFERYFQTNMLTKDENLKMFDYRIAKADISEGLLITDSAEFKRQVVEYAKYRAPVTTTMVLLDKVKSVFSNMKKNADTIHQSADVLEEFKDTFEKDANQISSALSSAKTEVSKNVKRVVTENIDKLKDDVRYVGEIRTEITQNFQRMYDSIQTSQATTDKMQQDTANYRNTASQNLSKINNGASGMSDGGAADDGVGNYPTTSQEKDVAVQADENTGTLRAAAAELKGKVDAIKKDVDGLVAELERLSGLIVPAKAELSRREGNVQQKKITMDEKARIFSEAYTAWNTYQNAQSEYAANDSKIKECEKQIDDVLFNYRDNEDYSSAVKVYKDPSTSATYDEKKPTDSSKRIREELRQKYSALKDIFDCIDTYNAVVIKRDAAANAMQQSNGGSLQQAYTHALSEKNNAEAAYQTAVQERDAQRGVVDAYSASIDSVSSDIRSKMDTLADLATPKTDELHIADLAKDKITQEIDKIDIIAGLKDLYRELSKEMLHYSTAGTDGDDVDSKLGGGLLKKIKSLCSYAADMFSTFTSAEKLRDNAYMVDYIMDKCTYLTSQTTRNHFFEKGEVEYIIFGKRSQVANITACITTITLMRFAINFIDYFVTAPGDLIAKAIYALGRGAAKTALDMQAMLISDVSEGVALCPSFTSLKLTYSDHLRLLLFFKFSNAQEGLKDTIYTNMKNTLGGTDFGQLYTRMTAKVEVEVNLLVLPMFIGPFRGANFRNGNYVIRDSATLGY